MDGLPFLALHESFLIVPNDQAAWRNHPDFAANYAATGIAFATLGAGPEGLSLVGRPNRPTDIGSHGDRYRIDLGGRDENEVIGLMLAYDRLFPDDRLYFLSGYTSNSYSRGLAGFAGLDIFDFPRTPGSQNPLSLGARR